MKRCKFCKKEAVYLMQYIGSDEPSFYFPGSHIRGFSTTPVCEECAERQRQAAQQEKYAIRLKRGHDLETVAVIQGVH